jgi:hypothetical protein
MCAQGWGTVERRGHRPLPAGAYIADEPLFLFVTLTGVGLDRGYEGTTAIHQVLRTPWPFMSPGCASRMKV